MRWTEEDLAAHNARKLHQTFREATAEMPEAVLLGNILGLARRHGWVCYHTHDSRKSEQGFPDLVLVRDTAIIFAELKSRTGKLTMPQGVWLEMLRRTGKVEVYLWRPGDWDAIQRRLAEPRKVID